MNDEIPLSPEFVVRELLDRHPGTAAVFLRHKMACVGCELSGFETLIDAAVVYNVPLSRFLDDLEAVVRDEQRAQRAGQAEGTAHGEGEPHTAVD